METKRERETRIIKLEQAEVINPDDLGVLQTSLRRLFSRGVVHKEINELMFLLESNQNGVLSKEQISASLRALNGLRSRQYLDPEDYSYLLNALEQEKRLAWTDWAKRGDKIGKALKVSTRMLIIAGFTYAGVNIWGNVYGDYLSPEGQIKQDQLWEARNAEKAAKQPAIAAQNQTEEAKKRETAIVAERENTLGLDWSPVSGLNWRIKYLAPNPNVKYEVVDSFIVKPDKGIVVDEPKNKDNAVNGKLNMLAGTYRRLDGKVVPKLNVITPSGQPNKDVYLRSESTPLIDAGIIYALDVELRRERWFKAEVDDASGGLVITVLKPIKEETPEQKAEAARTAEINERNMTLGSEFSRPSNFNWRIRSVPTEPNIIYEEILTQASPKVFKKDTAIIFPNFPDEKVEWGVEVALNMKAGTYKKHDGTVVPKLEIVANSSVGGNQIVILNNNMIYALDTKLQRERWLKVEVHEDNESLKITLMKPVERR